MRPIATVFGIVAIFCTSLYLPDVLAKSPEVVVISGDETLASLEGAANYISARDAVGRMEQSRNYPALIRVFLRLIYDQHVVARKAVSVHDTVTGALIDAPLETPGVSECLLNYLEQNNVQILNANSDGTSHYGMVEQIIGRLSRVTGVPVQEVNIHSTQSVTDFIVKIRPLMEKRQANTPGAPPMMPPPPSVVAGIPATPHAPASKQHVTVSPTVPEAEATGRLNGALRAWLAIGVSAAGLVLLMLKKRGRAH